MIPNDDAHTSHPSFSHDSISSLGYDWERIGDPQIAAKFPLKVYLPRSVDDVITAVNETRQLGQRLRIRSKGHSSNDLVLMEGGAVLCTELFNKVLDLDPSGLRVRVQSGAILAQLDELLSSYGLGLPVIGDHNHITAGGFASVGGISPSSHRYGLFIDNISSIEVVDWEGQLASYDRRDSPKEFNRVVAGTGQFGVIVTLTLELIQVQKWATILQNKRKMFWQFESFATETAAAIVDPGEAQMERGIWLDFPVFGRSLQLGQFSSYSTTAQSPLKRLANRLAYGYLHGLDYLSELFPGFVGLFFKYLGVLGLLFSPKYASIKNVESFTDTVIDESIGDPTRMLVALAPLSEYRNLIHGLYKICVDFRKNFGCLTFISFYIKGIKSPYLSRKTPPERFCELMLYLGVQPNNMTTEVLDRFIHSIDELCIQYGAFRYMHTKTSKEPEMRKSLDPNAFYAHAVLEGADTEPR